MEAEGKPTRTVKVDYLARVEGEGRLFVKVEAGAVSDARLEIFEPPRFFEAFLRGRMAEEASDITARICGICPVAYQMSAVHALEKIFGLELDAKLRELRRLLYCGEWIESHTLHVAMLHAPDFLGYESAVHMAQDHPDLVRRALALKKAGNKIVEVLGGREIHPINVRIGGFYRAPTVAELDSLRAPLLEGREIARGLVRAVAGFDFPDFDLDYTFVALRHPDEYPFNEGRLVSSRGLDIPVEDWDDWFEEAHVAHSNALQAGLRPAPSGPLEPYFVGPLARFALNFDRLPESVRALAEEVGVTAPCRNPFRSIVVRALEILFAVEEALRIIGSYKPPAQSSLAYTPRAGVGRAATEAPRGLLYHRYEVDAEGAIVACQIVPPTSQNQWTIEQDLRAFVPRHLDLDDAELTWRCEQAVRNYDPCISCATHFLQLDIER